MSYKKIFTTLFILLAGIMMVPRQASAQWSIGASYEVRNETPENGFGVRVERGILKKLPVVDLGLRAHFSYFSEENTVSQSGVTFSQDVKNYDYGLTATGGVSVGLLTPYIGLGLGSTTFDVSVEDASGNQSFDTSDSAFFWNALVGAKVNLIPKLKPFVEYRFQQAEEPQFAQNFDADGRFIVGLSLSF